MTILYLDFETQDEALNNDLGAGWAYKDKLEVIGYSYAVDSSEVKWSTDIDKLKELVKQCSVIVAHNATYECGILSFLNIDYKEKLIVCTRLLAILENNNRMSYSLNSLSKEYFNETKSEEDLGEKARELGLVKSKAQNAVGIAKKNMKYIFTQYPDTVIKYAIQDIELCRNIYLLHKDKYMEILSDLIKANIQSRLKGVLLDLSRVTKLKKELLPEINETYSIMDNYLKGRNPNSTKQLAEICDELNIKYPKTDKGNPSIKGDWIDQQSGEFFTALSRYKDLTKLYNDFLTKLLIMSYKITGQCLIEGTVRIHPEINIFGATKTGRFSSTNPNIQQQPKRSKIGRKIRSVFIPEQGEKWYCLDFSSQEPRMQVHFASQINSQSGIQLAQEWTKDPKWDMHGAVAKLASVDRNKAKIINLGLSYGMGTSKLANNLEVSTSEANKLKEQYKRGAPYLNDLTTASKNIILEYGYIQTILGRKLYKDNTQTIGGKVQDFSYKAINKLIQGSSADQTLVCMVEAYRAGINILFPVHDELCISTDDIEKVKKLKHIMENSLKLNVPSLTEVTVGENFGEQEEIEL